MEEKMLLRFRYKSEVKVCDTLKAVSTFEHLKDTIMSLIRVKNVGIRLLIGFPPMPLKDSGGGLNATLQELGIKSGETLIIETVNDLPKPLTKDQDHIMPRPLSYSDIGTLRKKVVPADNSCLFTSIYFIVTEGVLDPLIAKNMRKIIADVVTTSRITYSDAVLGKSNKDYCNWIMKDDSWGGAIEISILSQYYRLELVVVDTQTGRLNHFGEDKNYQYRGFLLYTGIHYDPLMWEESLRESRPGMNEDGEIRTIFSTDDYRILTMAREIGEEAKSAGQHVNSDAFALRCTVCELGFTRPEAAAKHTKETGHSDFSEVPQKRGS